MNFWTRLVARWTPKPLNQTPWLRLWPRRPLLELLEERMLPSSTAATKPLLDPFGQGAVHFQRNDGQTDPPVNFVAQGSGYAVGLTPTEAIFRLQQASAPAMVSAGHVVRLQFIGANIGARAVGLDSPPGASAHAAASAVSDYSAVEYQNVYRGINLVYYGSGGAVEYDFVVAPGANPGAIALRFQGAQGIHLDQAGNLVVHTAGGDLVETAPVLYQDIGAVRQPVAGRYVLAGSNQASFEIGAYDHSKSLVIDPATHFALSIPNTVAAGSTFGLTVIALDANSAVASDYTGIVQFASSDNQAALPPPYQFTAGDRGIHGFVATLNTLGNQSVTVFDRNNSNIVGGASTNVTITATYVGASGGDWDTATNWSTGIVPSDPSNNIHTAVVIPAGLTVVHSSNTSPFIYSLDVEGTLNLLAGNIQVGAGAVGPGTVTLNGTLNLGGVDSASLGGTLTLNGVNARLTGAGTAVFSDNANNSITFGRSGTIDTGITIRGQHGAVTASSAGVIITNLGKIQADTPDGSGGITVRFTGSTGSGSNAGTIKAVTGGSLTVGSSSAFTNTGTLAADGTGSVLSIGTNGVNPPVWTSPNGTISVTNNATLNLGNQFTQADLAHFTRDAGSTVNLIGTINGGLGLDATTGSWQIVGGTINSGTVSTTGGALLIATSTTGTLSGVTLNGTLDLTSFNSASIAVSGGMTLNGAINVGGSTSFATLNFAGADETITGTGSITFGGSAANSIFAQTANMTVTFDTSLTVHGNSGSIYGVGGVTYVNKGTIEDDVSGGAIAIAPATFSNSTGAVEALNGGTLTVNPTTLTNLSGGTLTGGTWIAFANSTLRGFSSGITTDAASILLSGAGANLYTGASGTTDALAGLSSVTSVGSFTVQNGRNFTTAAGFSNAGSLTVGATSTFTVTSPGAYTQSAGLTVVDGTITSSSPGGAFNIQGGTVWGKGTIADNVSNAGTLIPGEFPGILTITGNYTQTSAGVLEIDIRGTTAGTQYDQLNVSGTATLAGTLNAVLTNGFTPVRGSTIANVVTFASRSGDFTTKNLNQGNGNSFLTGYSGTGLNLFTAPIGTTVYWTNPAGGDWNTASNWSTGAVPIAPDNVYIGIAGSTFAVTLSSGNDAITSLISDDNFTLSGGTLTASGTVQVNGTFILSNGTLANATVVSGTTITVTARPGLSGVTLNGNLDVMANGSAVTVTNGLTENGTASVGGGGGSMTALLFSGTQTLGGTGDVLLDGGTPTGNSGYPDTALVLTVSNTTLTIGAGLTVHGGRAEIG
ncbi:MAG TPA: hypothetical protein VGY66_12835, partial [Gemmataceae bacterium]|nr:hypothetical protein [Gemmataceae bacterium]